jgi:CTP:phosphocholine cytidylyltransferase-like protein
MVGVSYLKMNEAVMIADAVEDRYGKDGYEDLFWDDVVDSICKDLKLKVWEIMEGAIAELDTVDELHELERKLGE